MAMFCNLFSIFVFCFWVLSLPVKHEEGIIIFVVVIVIIIIIIIIIIISYESLIEHLYFFPA
jgi:hypothetical protein